MSWVILFIAIFFEVMGTTFMKLTEGFTKLVPTILMFVSYGIGLTLMSLALRQLDVSIVYAIWSGLGTVLITIIGIFWFKEPATAIKLISITLIIFGVIGLNITEKGH
jgi:small multidrug resistance pump